MSEENKLNSFPYQVMKGAAGHFTNIYGQYLEVPESFLFMVYLTCLGNVICKKVSIKSELDTQPRLFTVVVGESATDRKSTALSIVSKFFRQTIEGFQPCWGVNSAEGLRKLLDKDAEELNEMGTLLLSDELKTFVSKCRVDNSVLLPCVNTLFEDNVYHSHTKKESYVIDDAYLSFIGASTLETYEAIYDTNFLAIGFTNRIFLVVGTAQRRFAIPEKIPEADIESLKNHLRDVLRHVGNGIELSVTSEARTLFEKWYLALPDSIHAKRLDGYALRLMMLLAVNSRKDIIDREIVEHATALCDWQYQVRVAHDPIDVETTMAKLEESIRRSLRRQPKKNRDLRRAVGAKYGTWYFENAMKGLKRSGEIEENLKKREWYLVD